MNCPTLPVTGAGSTMIAVIAAAALVAGGLLFALSRRGAVAVAIVALVAMSIGGSRPVAAQEECPPTSTTPATVPTTVPPTTVPGTVPPSTTPPTTVPDDTTTTSTTTSTTTTTTTTTVPCEASIPRPDEIFMLLGGDPPTGNVLANDDINSSPLTLVIASQTVGVIDMSTESIEIPVGPLGTLTVDRSGSYSFAPSGVTGTVELPYMLQGCTTPPPASTITVNVQQLN